MMLPKILHFITILYHGVIALTTEVINNYEQRIIREKTTSIREATI